MSKKTDPQKKYWWLTLIVVPIVAALVGQLSGILNFFKPPQPPAGTYTTNNMYLITQVYTTGQVSQEAQQQIDNAVALAQSGNYSQAIALLEEVGAQYPLPNVYNDLGVLYALNGDTQKAQVALQSALKSAGNSQPVNLNLGRLAEALGNIDEAKKYFAKAPDLYNPSPTTSSGSEVTTQIPGVSARLLEFSRFQNTITLKVRLDNSTATDQNICAVFKDHHLLDEVNGKKYEMIDESGPNCGLTAQILAANSSMDLWTKYSIPAEDNPQYYSAILGAGILFEHLTPK